MALNFPDSPTLNQIYTDATSGFSYQWDGVVWQSYTASSTKNILILTDISGSFDGLTTIFNLTDSVTSVAVTPANSQQLRVTLGGIVQEPGTDYLVADSTIIFTTAPSAGLDCSIVSLGPAVDIGVPGDGTVTPIKLSTGGPSWNTSGDVYIAGITTITNSSGTVIAGIGTTALIVEGNARVTGILTVGTSSITLDGDSNEIRVGSGVTLSSSTGLSGSGANLTSLNASNLSSGTIPNARFPATLPSASGANLTSLNASNLSSGTVATARLGSGSASSANFLRGDQTWAAAGDFASGTALLFQQTAAPTGWTKQTTHNDKSLRVVSGTASSGGTTAFTSVFTSRTFSGTVGNTTLTTTQMPSHTHSITLHQPFNSAGSVARGPGATGETANTNATGGGGAHNHSFTGSAADFDVQYVDVIIATKD